MKRINKIMFFSGSIAVIFLIISFATAVPQVHASTIHDIFSTNEKRSIISEKIKALLNRDTNQLEKEYYKIYSKLNEIENDNMAREQVNNLDSLMKEKYGEDFLEDFTKENVDEELIKEKLEKFYSIAIPLKNLKIRYDAFIKLSESLTRAVKSSSVSYENINEVLISLSPPILTFIYQAGLTIALITAIAIIIFYMSFVARTLFEYNTPSVALFLTVSFFILVCIIFLTMAFTWPIWIVVLIFGQILSADTDSNSINNLFTT
jgi:membrane-bound ClpP family serine protease